ncbi:MAG TPA: SPOR domain-containing protein [Anaeromyxobacteraceae bacterium]|nr:SPOR domain-containing protein [Anaeromyxobacteraceae bacterium]
MASVILGALASLGITFFLGYSLGHRVRERPPASAPSSAKASSELLTVLDQSAHPDGGEAPPKLSFHEKLTSPKPPQETLPPPPKPSAPAAAKPAAPPPPMASGTAPRVGPVVVASVVAAATTAGAAAGTPAAPPRPEALPVAPAPPAAASSLGGTGAFTVQVGSTTDRGEAERLAQRFPGRGARVSAADVPGKGRWYRVRVGAFKTREAAERYLRDLERDTGQKGFVTTLN